MESEGKVSGSIPLSKPDSKLPMIQRERQKEYVAKYKREDPEALKERARSVFRDYATPLT